jgi:hypothetical protein
MRATRRELLLAAGALPWISFRRDPRIAGIRFRQVRRDGRRRYIWLHGNERTALEVLSSHTEQARGDLFFIRSDERNVALEGGHIDPNRMWSRAGAERSLRSLNPGWTPHQIENALDKLDDDRNGVLRRILPPGGDVLVALHNNGPGYSVQDELPISDTTALNDKSRPDEFMLCTLRPDFELLAGGPFNVVLQSRAPTEDDGSLSRLCAARGVRYVNIEAAHGNAEAQTRMLLWVERVL